ARLRAIGSDLIIRQGLPEVLIPELLGGDVTGLVLTQEEACSEELTSGTIKSLTFIP
ncbi:hypothetical protein T484DRAFT_1873108, partial [Baffinella frigidus]